MELGTRKAADPTSGGLIMQRNKTHHVYTQSIGWMNSSRGTGEPKLH